MEDKPFRISKRLVWEAYKAVRANKGAAGYDEVDFDTFERHLGPNLYKIWNRMSSGSYFPKPVLAVEIPKANGKKRKLGIPTIEDRVAQMVVLKTIEGKIDPMFVDDSYGYRVGKSALDAVGTARERCWEFPYVVELDIKGLFDNIDHELLMRAVKMHVEEKWAILYIERWLTAPFIDRDGNTTPRICGTPQGGVISPLLANLFMHYAFDVWMRKAHPEAPFERYADDALIHCKTREHAERIKAELAARFSECRLEMNEEKTRIAYCKSEMNRNDEPITKFDFLGFTFGPRNLPCKDGKVRKAFVARVSKKKIQALKDRIKQLKIYRWTNRTIEEIALVINPIVRGWANYFSAYSPSDMDNAMKYVEQILIQWARRKYRNLQAHKTRAIQWLKKIRSQKPDLFVHWGWLSNGYGQIRRAG